MIFKNNFLIFIFNIILKLLKNINIIFFYIKRIFLKYPKKPKTEIISRRSFNLFTVFGIFQIVFYFFAATHFFNR
jgi:hypothetical protein